MGKRNMPPGFIDTKALGTVLEKTWDKSMKERGGYPTWNGKFTKGVSENYKISLCTTCMDRLDDLKQTMPKNILDNINYPHVEFVLLDYNSKDGLDDWVRENLMEYIERRSLIYIRTEEPEFFDMSHSRNVAFLAASGDIVNNIDADGFCGKGYAEFINKCANEIPEKAIFAKSRQLLRGRMGLYRGEFIELLGGYSEELKAYGHDDADLLHRAWELGFIMMPFSRHGDFVGIIKQHVKHQEGNYEKPWWVTEGENRLLSYANVICKRLKANEGRVWGKAKLVKNFGEEIEVGVQG